MPKNNDLPNKTSPMVEKWGLAPKTEFLHALNDVRVEMVQHPTREEVKKYIANFCLATWEDVPGKYYNEREKSQALIDLFDGKLLPNMLETMGFTFLISNIDLIDVTHLIRHRAMSFSAHCTGDSDQRFANAMVKPSIIGSVFEQDFIRIVKSAKALYSVMVDSKEISITDARTILPRCLANHYYARCNMRDLIPYFKQRLDKQIQPEIDNIIAIKILLHVARIFPEIGRAIHLNHPDMFYVKTAQETHSSNLYQPEEKNDIFDWSEQWFVYDCPRADMHNGHHFVDLWDILSAEYNQLVWEARQ